MSSQPLPPALKSIVDELSDLINTEKVSKTIFDSGWRYHGETVQQEIDKIKKLINQAGNEVIACHATHFTRGANIQNPTNRLILIQIRGTSKLDPGELLRPGSYLYLEDSRTLVCESEGGVDVGIVVLAKDTNFNM